MTHFVSKFYNDKPDKERDRLDHPYTRFEYETTLDLIEKHFPRVGNVCDIGCGPGRYSIKLLKSGYSVTMVDLSSALLSIAKKSITKLNLPPPKEIICADACELSMLSGNQFNAILHLGPMYHLIKKEQRAQSLSEVHRLLTKDGIAIISYLNAWGIIRYGLMRFSDLYEDMDFLKGMNDEVVIPESFQGFTECFWSTPPRANEELQNAGFKVITYIGCESFASGLKQPIDDLSKKNPKAYENVLQHVRATCELEQYRNTADHIHFVVRKI